MILYQKAITNKTSVA